MDSQAHYSAVMHTHRHNTICKPQQQFRLRFQTRLREMLLRYDSKAEAFGPAWEATVNEVPLPDTEQGEVYWQLIDWAKSAELFTG